MTSDIDEAFELLKKAALAQAGDTSGLSAAGPVLDSAVTADSHEVTVRSDLTQQARDATIASLEDRLSLMLVGSPADCDEAKTFGTGDFLLPRLGSVEHPTTELMCMEVFEHLKDLRKDKIMANWAHRNGVEIKQTTMCSGTNAPMHAADDVTRVLNDLLSEMESQCAFRNIAACDSKANHPNVRPSKTKKTRHSNPQTPRARAQGEFETKGQRIRHKLKRLKFGAIFGTLTNSNVGTCYRPQGVQCQAASVIRW